MEYKSGEPLCKHAKTIGKHLCFFLEKEGMKLLFVFDNFFLEERIKRVGSFSVWMIFFLVQYILEGIFYKSLKYNMIDSWLIVLL